MLLILLGLALLLAALKFHAGWASGSLILFSDGVNMLVVGAAVVSYWSGSRETGESQERSRIWTALVLGLLLLLCGWEILGIAFENLWFHTPAPALNWYAVCTAAGTGLMTFGLRRIPVWSEASCGTLTFSVWSTLLALLVLGCAPLDIRWIDPLGAVVVSLFALLGVRNLVDTAIFGAE